jgi:hypothetical protein
MLNFHWFGQLLLTDFPKGRNYSMKRNGTLFAILLGAALQASADPPMTQNPTATDTEINKLIKNSEPVKPKAAPNANFKIDRVGNNSSRPWAEIVGWHPGESAFPTAETAEPQLVVLNAPF